eukprot:1757197-Rhodomonas_salina.1
MSSVPSQAASRHTNPTHRTDGRHAQAHKQCHGTDLDPYLHHHNPRAHARQPGRPSRMRCAVLGIREGLVRSHARDTKDQESERSPT